MELTPVCRYIGLEVAAFFTHLFGAFQPGD
jgi:hypothetical protein